MPNNEDDHCFRCDVLLDKDRKESEKFFTERGEEICEGCAEPQPR